MYAKLCTLRRYAFAGAVVAPFVLFAIGLREMLVPLWPGHIATPLFMVAVAVVSWLRGIGPGSFSAIICWFCLEFLFLPPLNEVELQWADLPRFLSFLGTSWLVGILSVRHRAAEATLHKRDEELRVARAIQQRLLSTAAPATDGLDMAGAAFPAESVGGDYFDFIPLSKNAVAVVLGDVSGHGVGPGLVMVEVRAYVRALLAVDRDLVSMLTTVNHFLTKDIDSQFVTLVLLTVDRSLQTLSYVGAGHDAYIVNRHGGVQRLPSTCIPLGIDASSPVTLGATVEIKQDDVIVSFTDGFYEARSPQGEQFGIARLLGVVRENRFGATRQITDAVHRAVRSFTHCSDQEDDMTLVALKVTGETGAYYKDT